MAVNYTFVQSVKVVTGTGCVNSIGEVLSEHGRKKAFIVTTKGIIKRGQLDAVTQSLEKSGIEYTLYTDVQPDPPSEIVDAGADLCKSNGCDCVLAVGGGSSIDAAKGINVLRFNPGSILDYTSAPMADCNGLYVIPTTSGTGSELSNGAIISDTKRGLKLPVLCANNMPDAALLDPEMTVSMPRSVTMETGLDTFSHATEAYTSVLSNPMSDLVCESVMENVVRSLPAACENGADLEAREKMQCAAAAGGWMLYNACAHVGHSFAHVIGAQLHVVHGCACAYGLPEVLKLIAPAVPAKVKRIGEILGCEFDGSESAEAIGEKTAAAYRAFTTKLGLPKLDEAAKAAADVDSLAEEITKEAFAPLCPVQITKENAADLVRKALEI